MTEEITNRWRVTVRSLAIWLLLIVAEIAHGILRAILLVPMIGEFRSNQIGVFTGSVIILVIAYSHDSLDRCNETFHFASNRFHLAGFDRGI